MYMTNYYASEYKRNFSQYSDNPNLVETRARSKSICARPIYQGHLDVYNKD